MLAGLAAVNDAPEPAHDRTPPAWRIAALAALAAGAAMGAAVARQPARRVAAAGTLGVIASAGVAAAGARRARRARRGTAAGPGAGLPRITVVVAARDEVEALPALVRDLGRQDHRDADGTAWFDLVVVDDRSVDGTADAVRAAAVEAGVAGVTTVVRRPPGAEPDGKGAALAAVPDDAVRGAAMLVLDADARLGPDVVRRVAERVAAGEEAFTARRRVAGTGWAAALQDGEQVLDAWLQGVRSALGGSAELRGNGMVVATHRLRAAGGWRAGTLTEDLDLSTRLALAGARVGVADDVEVWEASTATLRAFGRQRLRWAEGSARRHLELAPAVVRAAGLRPAVVRAAGLRPAARADLLLAPGVLVAPVAVLAAVVAGVARRRPGAAAALVASCGAGAALLSGMALRDASRPRPGGRVGPPLLALAEGAYLLHWLVAAPAGLAAVALRPGRVRFARTRERRLPGAVAGFGPAADGRSAAAPAAR